MQQLTGSGGTCAVSNQRLRHKCSYSVDSVYPLLRASQGLGDDPTAQ